MTTPPCYGRFDGSKLTARPFTTESLPDGWLYGVEATVLYNAALVARGPIIEVGPWIGRSTCALAYGVRDNPLRPILDVFDWGVASIDQCKKLWGLDPRSHPESEHVLKQILYPGGSGAVLIDNLVRRKLDQYVHMFVFGEFLEATVSRKYSVCFCDASHGIEELKRNGPHLMSMMDPDNWLIVFDDIWDPAAAKFMHEFTNADKAVSLGGGYPNGEADNGCKITIAAKGTYAQLPWLP
jgi:Methyltransferase domain